MFQIAAVGLICAVLSLAVRSWRPEFSIYISAASGLVLFAMVYSQLEGIISGVSGLFQKSGSAGVYFPVLLKVIGIAYLTDFSAQVCRDAGENGIASKVEMAGKITLILLSMPILMGVIDLVVTIVEG